MEWIFCTKQCSELHYNEFSDSMSLDTYEATFGLVYVSFMEMVVNGWDQKQIIPFGTYVKE